MSLYQVELNAWDVLHEWGRDVNAYKILVGRREGRKYVDMKMDLNPLNTKRRMFYLKTQFVPRSKHFSSRL